MIIPHKTLSKSALGKVIEQFVLGEGTDYGFEVSFEQKCQQVLKQIEEGKAVVVFDSETETCSLRPAWEIEGQV